MAFRLSPWTYLFLLYFTIANCVADPTFYSIWPLFNPDGVNADGSSNQKITDELKKDLNNDDKKLYTSRTEALKSTWYWYAELTDDQLTKYRSFAGVRTVAKPDNGPASLNFRATRSPRDTTTRTDFTNDADAPDQLKLLSLPGNKALSDSKGYKFDSKAGDGINIYVIDSGLTESSPEFVDKSVDWLFAGPFADQDHSDVDVSDPDLPQDRQGHGTCMASIAMGNKDGVARKASLTVVKADRYSTQLKRDASAEVWIDGLAQIYDDVINKKAKSKAVVHMSIGTTGNKDKNYEACYAAAFTKLINALEEQDVPVAAAVGNLGTEIANYPALLAKATKDEKSGLVSPPQCPALIVVGGAVVNSGDFYNDIRDEEIKVYGPADDDSDGPTAHPGLECASRDGKGYHSGNAGTSQATAHASGLLAYFMSQGNTGAASRQNLFNVAIQRIKNGPKIINNDVDGTS